MPEHDCHLSHTRPVWRLEKGRALVIAYAIYRGPKNQYGKVPGVFGRSECGVEIVVEIAYDGSDALGDVRDVFAWSKHDSTLQT